MFNALQDVADVPSPLKTIEWYKAKNAQERAARERAESARERAESENAILNEIESEVVRIEQYIMDTSLEIVGQTNALNAVVNGFDLMDDQSDLTSPISDSKYGLDLGGIEFGGWDN